MQFRVATLNLEQDHKRWSDRQPLISGEIAALKPDVIAFNESAFLSRRRGSFAIRRPRRPESRTI